MRIIHFIAMAAVAASLLVVGCKGSEEEELSGTKAAVGTPPSNTDPNNAPSGAPPKEGMPAPGPKKSSTGG